MAKVRPNSKKSKKKPKPLTAQQLERRRRTLRLVIQGCAIVATTGLFLIGYNALAAHVHQTYATVEQPPALKLADRPAWMTDRIAAEIAGRVARLVPPNASTLDHDLLVQIHDMLSQDAWIEQVNRVRRVNENGRDTIEIDCLYRTPLAIVRWDNGREAQYRLVAANSTLLPPSYDWAEVQEIVAGRDASTNLRVITGVAKAPPAMAGGQWMGDDLKAGLDVAAVLHGHPAARDVTVIDVSNFPLLSTRDRAQVELLTKQETRILWGRPPHASDFLLEVSPQQKLAHLQTVAEQFRGKPYPAWIDVRGDVVKVKAEPAVAE